MSPDGQQIALASLDEHLTIVDLSTPKAKVSQIAPKPASLAPDGPNGPSEPKDKSNSRLPTRLTWITERQIASGNDSGQTKLWDLRGKRELATLVSPNQLGDSPVVALHSPTGRNSELLVAYANGVVELRDLLLQSPIANLNGPTIRHSRDRFPPPVRWTTSKSAPAVLFASGQEIWAASETDLGLRPWGVSKAEIDGGPATPNAIALSPDGGTLAIGHLNGSLELLKANGESQVVSAHQLPPARMSPLENKICLAWSPEGDRLASFGNDWRLLVWDIKTLELIHEWEIEFAPQFEVPSFLKGRSN